ncbi:MAG: hypothetical protein CVV41_06775 [Candidatus Riflebacteria bacterium HGW-Riflebacteria-1]|jgi:predicted transcriptional regulator|nr:MAG: hypothetical protein CVV41_06775 [Candidatus Riflebacteria bacterium HGW-Riflebacteria-1]
MTSNNKVPRVPSRSWNDLEGIGLAIRQRVAVESLKEPSSIDLASLFEADLKWLLGYEYQIKHLPSDVEAMTLCKSKQIILSHETYDSLGDESSSGYGRARFTVAHEICHIAVHAKYLRESTSLRGESSGIRLNRSFLKPYEDPEIQANAFAARFLMPTFQVEMLLREGATINEIAEVFGVSYEAACYRVNSMKKK